MRYSLFERAPYDPLNKNAVDRYKKYYEQGAIDQDLRFGNVAFQGITFSGNSFPWWFTDGVSFQGILGKTQNNIANIVAPGKDDYCFGLRLNKTSQKEIVFLLTILVQKLQLTLPHILKGVLIFLVLNLYIILKDFLFLERLVLVHMNRQMLSVQVERL